MLTWIVGPTGRFDTGVAKYSFELINALKKFKKDINIVSYEDNGKPNSLSRYIWQFILLPLHVVFKTRHDDLVIYQEAFSHLSFFRMFSNKKTMIIIHHVPEVNDLSIKGLYLKSLFFLLSKMKHVVYIVPTSFTGKLLNDVMKLPNEKINIVPNAISYAKDSELSDTKEISIVDSILEKKKKGYTIALNVGSFEKRKNLSVLTDVFRQLRNEKIYFIKAGFAIDEKNKNAFDTEMKESGIDYLLLDKVSSELICKLYECSDLYLATSTYEGFGRTLVEAQNAKCIVISSSIPAHNEIMNNAALEVTSYLQSDEWVKMIKTSLSMEQSERNKLIADGLINSSRFSPVNVAQTFMKIL